MKFKIGLFLILIFNFAQAAQGVFLSPFHFTYTLVGAEYIHSPPPGARISAYVPLPEKNQGHMEDFNSYGYYRSYPLKFTVGDGTLLSPFIYVDIRENSPLKKMVKQHANIILKMSTTRAGQIIILKDYVSKNILDVVPTDDPVVQFFKKENYSFPEFQSVGQLSPGHFPVSTGFKFHTIKFEDLIRYGKGFCIHKVLLTSLIMKELRIPHNIRFGSTGFDGHDWIELPDGRILDPTWNLLQRPRKSELGYGWFKLDMTSLYKYHFYPFAVWK